MFHAHRPAIVQRRAEQGALILRRPAPNSPGCERIALPESSVLQMIRKEETVLAARAGNVEAFGRLVEADGTAVYRLCYSVLRSHADAEDAAQETFIRAWRELPKLREVAAWQGWLRRIAVRASIDRSRGLRRLREIRSEMKLVGADPAIASDARDEMGRAFGLLTADDRALLALRFYLDLQVPDVAKAMGIPLGTAKSRLHRALERLRHVLEAES